MCWWLFYFYTVSTLSRGSTSSTLEGSTRFHPLAVSTERLKVVFLVTHLTGRASGLGNNWMGSQIKRPLIPKLFHGGFEMSPGFCFICQSEELELKYQKVGVNTVQLYKLVSDTGVLLRNNVYLEGPSIQISWWFCTICHRISTLWFAFLFALTIVCTTPTCLRPCHFRHRSLTEQNGLFVSQPLESTHISTTIITRAWRDVAKVAFKIWVILLCF